ncbi:hypothetical protein HBI24_211100 [Parastagonospora nodorum]|nr:hypothetical protein HBH50_217600 [Parastagonospora nodorum]KAH4080185.1 hypothetical protein HBH48_212850 [Parastagonospora nodorum]KAH4156516.1 hypothetical protein HBH43_208730 [Parastagonospora nodorum]KAH4198233.1 hypothetical protein HBI95_180090 [Parastagonospora nodorum]KAH4252542.1 hypothetical protein HBI03_210520 [Parastagonospora nodorum]
MSELSELSIAGPRRVNLGALIAPSPTYTPPTLIEQAASASTTLEAARTALSTTAPQRIHAPSPSKRTIAAAVRLANLSPRLSRCLALSDTRREAACSRRCRMRVFSYVLILCTVPKGLGLQPVAATWHTTQRPCEG